jgi:hypothetical protein
VVHGISAQPSVARYLAWRQQQRLLRIAGRAR